MAPSIPSTTLDAQARASHPLNSAWVSANAGSGKTFVLSRRVIRLLLAGTEPARILCLTFTKAAAAEMSNRVFRSLSEWIDLSDAALIAELTALEGHPPSPETVERARRLFARALETPGGLKIQTIHAFAERLLHQFPLEANVPAHFEILDDQLAADLLGGAIGYVMQAAYRQDRQDWADALGALIDQMGDMDITKALTALVRDREGFGRFMELSEHQDGAEGQSGLDAALANLANALGVSSDDSLDALAAAVPFGPLFPRERMTDLAPLYEAGGANDKKQAILIRQMLASDDAEQLQALWLSFFMTKQGQPKALRSLASKKIWEPLTGLAEDFVTEQDRLLALQERRAALITLDMSRALFTLADGVIGHYERAKASRGLMDFDDLILKCADLLRPAQASAWVHYKLDQGIDHILVDEAQDTNPYQWDIIRQLGEEFFTGDSARGVDRTVFAVGDEKQSIYSFQGAEPKWFADMRQHFASRAQAASKPFHKIDLQLSFRSTPHILKAVDEIFAREETYNALTADKEPTVHEAIRRNDPGLVELWPLVEPEEVDIDEDWAAPLDAQGATSPSVQVANQIGDTIKHWLANEACLEGSGKRIGPGDILILVRKRGAFVNAMNRALKERGLPVAGADRLELLDHIAIMDLMALGDVMLLPQDDLSLAAVLKSPLIGLSEERLFDLAHSAHWVDGVQKLEPRKVSLWEALRKRADAARDAATHPDRDFVAIYGQLRQWQSQIDFQPPFDFYAQLLGPDGKRAAFLARLGPEADEVMDEFLSRALSFEKNQTPNLQAFLAAMRQGGAEIKRDMGAADGQIRVMTVHGSKGLEAPIVFLVDGTGRTVSAQHHPNLVQLPGHEGNADLMAWKAPRKDQPAPVAKALDQLEQAAEEEYLRLLYVGMTRAEDRLYLCGYSGKNGPAENCWYEVTRRSLSGDAIEVPHPVTGDPVLRWQLAGTFSPKAEASTKEKAAADISAAPLPDFLTRPAPLDTTPIPVINPSRAADQMEHAAPMASSAVPSGVTHGWEPRRRGTLLHGLFEHLPRLDPALREERGLLYLDRVAADMPLDARHHLVGEALALLEHPDYVDLFGSDGQAEVSLAGWLDIAGARREVSGQIDRLVITDDAVLVVDFKTNQHVPAQADLIPPDYQLQMAIYGALLQPLYPDKAVRCLLLWTNGPVMTEVSNAQRQSALDQFAQKTRIGS